MTKYQLEDMKSQESLAVAAGGIDLKKPRTGCQIKSKELKGEGSAAKMNAHSWTHGSARQATFVSSRVSDVFTAAEFGLTR